MARARKRFAQHFLEPAWVAKLVTAIAASPHDRFIEIGPGRGAITRPLAAQASRVVAVELDRDLAAALGAGGLPNVTVINGDVLQVDLVKIAAAIPSPDGAQSPAAATPGPLAPVSPIRVVGNLPYNISSPILFQLLEASMSGLFKDATLMLQKEVADRLVAPPGTGEYGVLTLSTLVRADVKQLLSLPPGAFRPMPKVRSAVIRLDFRPPPPEVHHPELAVQIVRSVFTQRRKTLGNSLAPLATSRGREAHDVLNRADIDSRRRPETLSLLEFARIADVLVAPPDAPPETRS